MKTFPLWLAVASLLVVSAPARAQEPPSAGASDEASVAAVKSAIRSNRKALIAVNLGLTDAEAGKFWPVYERYQKELNAVGDRQIAVIDDYIASFATLTDEHARKLIDDYLATEAERAALRRKYVDAFAGALPGRKLARFYQLENKMDAVLRYELAAKIPIVEEAKAPAK